MTRPLPTSFAAIAACVAVLSSPHASAQGFNLAWGSGCWADNPTSLQTFSCDSNSGTFTMTASFAVRRDATDFTGFFAQLNLQSDSPALPDWWQLSGTGCRPASLAGNADFTSAPGGCTNPWAPGIVTWGALWRTAMFPAGGSYLSPSRAELLVACSTLSYSNLQGGVEYYAFRVVIDAQSSIGPGACGGCATPMAIVMNEIQVGASHSEKITAPLSNACLRWQAEGQTPCSATPARNRTWGTIKSLYR